MFMQTGLVIALVCLFFLFERVSMLECKVEGGRWIEYTCIPPETSSNETRPSH
jgi:hypothetical protein